MILLLLIEFSDAGVAVYGANVYPRTIFKLGFIEVYLMYRCSFIENDLYTLFGIDRKFLVGRLVNSRKFNLKEKL